MEPRMVRSHQRRYEVAGEGRLHMDKGLRRTRRPSPLGLTHTALQPLFDHRSEQILRLHMLYARHRSLRGGAAKEKGRLRRLVRHYALAKLQSDGLCLVLVYNNGEFMLTSIREETRPQEMASRTLTTEPSPSRSHSYLSVSTS